MIYANLLLKIFEANAQYDVHDLSVHPFPTPCDDPVLRRKSGILYSTYLVHENIVNAPFDEILKLYFQRITKTHDTSFCVPVCFCELVSSTSYLHTRLCIYAYVRYSSILSSL